MTLPKVFIASSSEGLDVAKAIHALLLGELDNHAEVRPWPRAFELSAAYIESLEKAAEEADFAVVIVTPDDVNISRDKKKAAPRDNVVFELGLFMGCLGRERCFVVNEERADLKLPTDLLGVKTASFKRSADRDLRVSLDAPSLAISERIEKLGTRYKLGRDVLAFRAALRPFCESIEGAWWERITRDGINVISFFWIEPDAVVDSVSLSGKSYDGAGNHVANWKSVIARVDKDANKILYHWQGWHTLPDLANAMFHGFGEMEFDKPPRLGDMVTRGVGKFWDVDETHPEKTLVKPTQLRRVVDDKPISTMTGGSEKAIRSLIEKILSEW